MQLCRLSDIRGIFIRTFLLVVSASVTITFFESLSLLNSLPRLTSGNVPSQPYFQQAMFFLIQIWIITNNPSVIFKQTLLILLQV